MNDITRIPEQQILGAKVHFATMQQVLDIVDDSIKARKLLMIGVINAAKVMNMRKNPELAVDVNGSNLVLADGMSIVYASHLLRRRLPERISGIDLMHCILEQGNDKRYRVYCLGATEEVSATVEQRFRAQYPGVVLAGRRNGYFNDDEEQAIAEDIAKRNVDVLFVAITSPKKERFMARWAGQLNVCVIHGVGGSFDVVAGLVQRAPQSWQKLGLEWLYRVKQEPRRLWKRYLITNVAFVCALSVVWVRSLIRDSKS